MAKLIDGKAIAAAVRREVQDAVATRAAQGAPPSLVAVQVADDAASDLYVRRQERSCAKLGIAFQRLRLPSDATEGRLLDELAALNGRGDVTGIILQMPLPAHINPRVARRGLAPDKDVEGVHPENLGWLLSGRTTRVPPTAAAALACIESTGVQLKGAEAVVIGHSETVGKPVALLLMERLATVTVAHHATDDVAAHTARADVVVVAVGKPGLVTASMIKPGAVVVDVGINEVEQEDGSTIVVGDVDASVADQAGWLSPVPGGVGPVTVAMLMRNATK
ncbi:MAG: bifunctional 5,10-methylenetetrahydrofolate dehydrogenase/5,10-methenyltetrahydrofolate cyclohydrolase [Planctomycetota bacterium]|nr:bifunctional 5,10-methylenetetrahydrofolate dehydrogenase/5,10-methenyltetrahydrofolate cyclohydrolase [Planctomycetota bacterium]